MRANEKLNTAIDLGRFAENRSKIPWAQLAPFAGSHVAFSADGTRVLAHGPDTASVEQALRAKGVGSSEVVWSYIPRDDEESWL